MPEQAFLEARGLTRRYGRTAVLASLDLTLVPGECLLVLGPNGAGKSTLLRTLAGLSRPDRGSVLIEGRPVAEQRSAVGYLAHETMLYDDLTVVENLAFTARLVGCDVATTVPLLLEQARLVDHRDRLVRHLSRGLAQRAALARSLMHAPRLLILDEPFTGLDGPSAAALTAMLRSERERGVAIVLVGHRPEEGWEAVTRVGVLARGGWAYAAPRPAEVSALEARYREVLVG